MSNPNWQQIRTEYEQGGLSLRQLAAKYGVSKTYLIEKRNKENWNRPTTDRPPTTILAESISHPTPEKNVLSTKDKQRLFLESYATQANVMLAARAAGIHRTTVYDWLEKDEDFSFAYNHAKESAKDMLRAEIYRRGHDGWEEDVYSFGKFQGTVHKYSDTLLIFHTKMLMPEYRDKSSVDVNATVTGKIEHVRKLHALTDEELEALERLAMKAMEGREHGS